MLTPEQERSIEDQVLAMPEGKVDDAAFRNLYSQMSLGAYTRIQQILLRKETVARNPDVFPTHPIRRY